MSDEKQDRERERLWRPLTWLGLVGCLVALSCAFLHQAGYIDAAAKNWIAATGAAIIFGLYLIAGFVALEMPIKGYRLRFGSRPILFSLWFVFVTSVFLLALWESLGLGNSLRIDR